MTPDAFHDFFVAAAGVAGALIGLLFVALSVAPERVADDGGDQIHRLGALAAFTAFTNALTVSLFALIPGLDLGPAVTSVAVVGLIFIAAALLSLLRRGPVRLGVARDGSFLLSLLVVFSIQLRSGIRMDAVNGAIDPTTVSILVVVCFLIGISRAWALVGAPNIGLRSEVVATVRSRRRAR
jgi:hypothetical protein